MRPILRCVTFVTMLGAVLAAARTDALAVTAGVDIAAPRVAMTTANGTTLRFVPAAIVVEQGDYIQWNWTSGAHTTTSGSACVASGLWTSPLNSTTPLFLRQFLETPGALPFFCMPHCGFGMVGQVTVTSPILETSTDAGGAETLSWTGGGGTYQVFRSDSPLFTAATTTLLTPAGGTTATTFVDQTGAEPAVDHAFFYLVMNQF